MEYRKDGVQLLTDFEMLLQAARNAFAEMLLRAAQNAFTGRMLCRPELFNARNDVSIENVAFLESLKNFKG